MRNFLKHYLIYGKSLQSEQLSQQRGSAFDSEKGIELPFSEHKIRSKAGVKPIKTAVCVLF